ncbi:DNA helicase RecQ [Marixanthomonas spongiae]|uniref:DNA helicase RecQ n=1 Tax=Marixanthomonas spongiae TaxID=2174845 RepID=A0A2U0I2G8_9FLAO|nr:DNA helicase RecQ [Marixanthomonas spongiae]PVW15312.1 DNA helicase RecQ [Marixanthomonas spongiae]
MPTTNANTSIKPTLHDLLKTHFGYDAFLPNQEKIIKNVLNQNDTLAIMPTGGGKSLCFQLPALALPGTAIVVSPLIALMKDQVDALRSNGIAAAYFNSSQPQEEQQQTLSDLQEGKLKLFYVAPESIFLLENTLHHIDINLFAIDEAHCISSWGHDFRPAYTQLGSLKEQFPQTPLIALTATADSATQDDIAKQLAIPNAKKFIASFDRPNLYLDVRPGQKRIQQILQFLKSHTDESGIIYCLSRKSTESVADKLLTAGYDAKAYHAGISSEERSQIQEDFVTDKTSIIVATIAFGMGIDKSNVRWVIHYNMPKNIEGYYQEIGRSGRDGLPAHTLLFYSFADVVQLRKFAEGTPTEEYQLAKLERMQQFAEALSCRRRALLGYFGEHLQEDCGNCDICNTPPTYFDGTLLAQKVCSAVARLQEQEALGMVIDVLRGAQNAQVFNKGYQNIKTYGAANDVSWRDLQQYVIQLINQGVLEIRFHENGRLILTPLAKAVLFENRKIYLARPLQKKEEEKTTIDVAVKSNGLFDKLKNLRLELAKEMGVPAYVIFSDASLKDMVAKVPQTEMEFSEISGVGQAKLEKYAAPFLKIIKEEQKKNPKKRVKATKKKRVKKTPTHLISLALFNDGLTVDEISTERNLTTGTIYAHLEKAHISGEEIEIERLITSEEIEKIVAAKDSIENPESLKSYFEYFEAKVPYWKIKLGLHLSE